MFGEVEGFELEVPFNPGAQIRKVEEAAHKLNLVENGLQEEQAESGQRASAEVASAIEVVFPWPVGVL